MKTQARRAAFSLLVCLALLAAFSPSSAQAPASSLPPEGWQPAVSEPAPPAPEVEYFAVETKVLDNGTSIDQVTINGPPTPPPGFERTVVELPEPSPEAGQVTLSEVPAYDWSYGVQRPLRP